MESMKGKQEEVWRSACKSDITVHGLRQLLWIKETCWNIRSRSVINNMIREVGRKCRYQSNLFHRQTGEFTFTWRLDTQGVNIIWSSVESFFCWYFLPYKRMSVVQIIWCMVVKSVQSPPYLTNRKHMSHYRLPSSGSKPHMILYVIPQCQIMQFQICF